MVIRKIGVASAAKVFGTLHAIWGLIFGACIALFALVGSGIAATHSDDPVPGWLGAMFGVGAIIVLPIFYGILGAIFGALTAAFYNVVAGMAGGLTLDVE
jgi:hypothetical protein